MDANNVARKALAWFGLLLALIFVTVGLAILTGFILSEHAVFGRGIRTTVGLVLVGYGIFRGISIYRQIAPRGKGVESD